MEDNVQTIIMTLVAIVVFFIFPTYVAYEKKDDLAYSLALKYTQTFVDNVRSKGYVSKEMYYEYTSNLANTGNRYDINLEHRRKRAEPVANYYAIDTDGQEKIIDFKNQESWNINDKNILNPSGSKKYSDVQKTYRMDEEVISGKQVLSIIDIEDFYQMNVGDEFTVILKNTNTTFATIFYNLITIGGSDTNTRIYVNYGGSVTNETWTKIKSYAEYDRITVPVGAKEEYLTDADTVFPMGSALGTNTEFTTNFVIEFMAFPKATTELPTEGTPAYDIPVVSPLSDTPKVYNYLIKDLEGDTTKVGMGVTIGTNGLAITLRSNNYYYSVLTYNQLITEYTSFKIVYIDNKPTLYVNGLKVAEGIKPPTTTLVIDAIVFVKSEIGNSFSVNQNFVGNAKDIKFYNISI